MIDLHTHSTASDGFLSPSDLIEEAERHGLTALALTDHDTLSGLDEADRACRHAGIEFIPGVELSTEVGAADIHILGYYVDSHDQRLAANLAELAGQREERARQVVAQLSSIGLPVAFDRVVTIAAGGAIGRPHVARAMIEQGYVATVGEAIERYLGNGKPGFVPRAKALPEDAVKLLTRSRAIPVLAHPLTSGDIEATLRRLVPLGLQGIEVYYGEYDPSIHADLQRIATRWNLIATGGSDFHGSGFKEGRDLGAAPVPGSALDALKSARRALGDWS